MTRCSHCAPGAARIALSAALDSDDARSGHRTCCPRLRIARAGWIRRGGPLRRTDRRGRLGRSPRPEDVRAEGDGAEGDGDPVAMAHALTALLQDRLGSAFTRANHEVRERLTPVAADRRRRARRMAVLAPVATAGVAANAPAILPDRSRLPLRATRGLAGDDQGGRRHGPVAAELDRHRSGPVPALGADPRGDGGRRRCGERVDGSFVSRIDARPLYTTNRTAARVTLGRRAGTDAPPGI
ncbi:MAG: hypothetical protein M5U19_17815 [Microthrixaceae bacterium]|nr:hypothetical protein [Microthrixaceae bacterium]